MELLAHVGRETVEQALHGGDALLHLLDKLVKALRRVVAKEVAVLLHEALEIGLAAGHLLRQHGVQVAQHLLHACHLFRAHVRDLLVEVLEEGVHQRLLQHLHQLLELGAGLGVHELVVLELFDAAAGVFGQIVEGVLLAFRDGLEHLGELLLLLGGLFLAGRLNRLFEGLKRALAALELTVCFVETPVDGFSLEGHDLVELLLDVVEDGGEVVAVELLAALLAELLEEVAETFETLAEGVAHAALEEVAEGVLEVAEVQEVIGEAGEDVIGVEGRDILRAVPFGVAEAVDHAGDIIHGRSCPHPGPVVRPSPAWRARVGLIMATAAGRCSQSCWFPSGFSD